MYNILGVVVHPGAQRRGGSTRHGRSAELDGGLPHSRTRRGGLVVRPISYPRLPELGASHLGQSGCETCPLGPFGNTLQNAAPQRVMGRFSDAGGGVAMAGGGARADEA